MPEPGKGSENAEKTSKILNFFNVPLKEQKKEKVKPLSKVVIRRLPPRWTKEVLENEFTLPEHDFFYFVKGDLNLGNHAFSRAYINICNPDDIFAFKEKYDDYPLQDEQGREYHAVVEWAPQQRIPKKSIHKKSSKSGTIEVDPKYVEFLEKLEQEKNNPGNTSEYFMETDSVTTKEVKVTTTPLLEYIKLRRQQKIDIRNENRIRKREAEKEKRRKEDDMRRAEKQRKEKEKTTPKVDVKEESVDDESKETNKASIKEEKKHIETKTPRPSKSDRFDPKNKDEKYEKKLKSPRKPENETGARTNKGSHHNPKLPENEDKLVATSSADSIKGRTTIESKKDPYRSGEVKSKFRYSEQRNRDRQQKFAVDPKNVATSTTQNEKEQSQAEKRDIAKEEMKETSKDGQISRQSTQETSDGSIDGDDGRRGDRKDPRVERRIRNKDRPSLEIYRPGMGKFSKQRLDVKKDEPDAIECKKETPEIKKVDESVKKSKVIKDEDIKPFRSKKVVADSDTGPIQKLNASKNVDDVLNIGEEKITSTSKDISNVKEEITSVKPDDSVANDDSPANFTNASSASSLEASNKIDNLLEQVQTSTEDSTNSIKQESSILIQATDDSKRLPIPSSEEKETVAPAEVSYKPAEESRVEVRNETNDSVQVEQENETNVSNTDNSVEKSNMSTELKNNNNTRVSEGLTSVHELAVDSKLSHEENKVMAPLPNELHIDQSTVIIQGLPKASDIDAHVESNSEINESGSKETFSNPENSVSEQPEAS